MCQIVYLDIDMVLGNAVSIETKFQVFVSADSKIYFKIFNIHIEIHFVNIFQIHFKVKVFLYIFLFVNFCFYLVNLSVL